MPPTVTELAEEVRESNRRLAEAIHDLRGNFSDFRVEIAEKLGAINGNLESFRGRTETSFKVAVWGISMATVIAISVIGAVIAGTWYAAKLDSRVMQLESQVGKNQHVIPKPTP
jgi:hypothetical protein